jgi:hypothetical protein
MGYARVQGSNFITIYSGYGSPFLITDVAANKTLPSISLPAFEGAVVLVYADIGFTQVINQFAGINHTVSVTSFEVSPDNVNWYTAGYIPNNSCYLLTDGISGTLRFFGSVDVKAYVPQGGTLYFRIIDVEATGSSLWIPGPFSCVTIYFQ